MSQRCRINAWHAHRLQPAQHAQLGVRIAQPVEDHHAQRQLDRRGEAGASEHGRQAIKAQFVPKLVERPHIAERQCRLKAQLRRRARRGRKSFGAQQTVEQRIDLAAVLINATQCGDGALAGLAVLIAERLHQLG